MKAEVRRLMVEAGEVDMLTQKQVTPHLMSAEHRWLSALGGVTCLSNR